jgi:hypothetical protein
MVEPLALMVEPLVRKSHTASASIPARGRAEMYRQVELASHKKKKYVLFQSAASEGPTACALD